MQYFVSYYRHVITDDSWDYRMIGRYSTLTEAEKAYHNKLASDIGSDVLDSVTVIIVDHLGNPIASKNWMPESEPVTTEEPME